MRTTACPVASPPPRARRSRPARGAVLVHVAVAFTGLVAFSALSIDLGVLWAARRQAQNAADGAALAGAISLAYVDPSNEDHAKDAARAVAAAHEIWGEAVANPNLMVGPCPAGAPVGGECVQAEVGRTGAMGTPLPNYIAPLFGYASTWVRATGVAQILTGNMSSCLRPWAIADRWDEQRAPAGGFNAFDGEGLPLPGLVDGYRQPNASSSGSGYTVADTVGQRLSLERGDIDHSEIYAEQFFMMELPRTEPVANPEIRYQLNIESCSSGTYAIGDVVPLTQTHQQATINGVDALIAQDPGASWDGSAVRGSAFPVSPRIVTVAFYDPAVLAAQARGSGFYNANAVIRNIAGFFVEGFVGNRLEGVIVMRPGLVDPSGDTVSTEAAFLKTVALVR
jgi:hypothetical protein